MQAAIERDAPQGCRRRESDWLPGLHALTEKSPPPQGCRRRGREGSAKLKDWRDRERLPKVADNERGEAAQGCRRRGGVGSPRLQASKEERLGGGHGLEEAPYL